ncbi:MAG: 4'-phosphopantetheinyl transferase superfamily protein [Bacteroidales bacterium]|jgi:4'-phosphopantetheinyl transferase EntD|nr:4'-phosphopantetheinyl transferase superfamily protein [Bacteroidales bacterium]
MNRLPIIKKIESDAYQLVLCALCDIDYSQAEAILSLDEKKRYHTLSGKRRQEFAASRIVLHRMMGSHYEHIRYTAEGKPFLATHSISISHSKQYCAVIVGKGIDVGVDIEEYREKIQQIAPRFMNSNELQTFKTIEDLTLVWSAKEALFKLSNAGANFCEHFCINSIEGDYEKGVISAKVTGKDLHFFQNLLYFRHQNFCLVWTINTSNH